MTGSMWECPRTGGRWPGRAERGRQREPGVAGLAAGLAAGLGCAGSGGLALDGLARLAAQTMRPIGAAK